MNKVKEIDIKKDIKNKKENFASKKSIFSAFFASILKLGLAVALLILLALIVNAGDVVVESGKVGIGTTSPDYKLEIESNSATAYSSTAMNNFITQNLANPAGGGYSNLFFSVISTGTANAGQAAIAATSESASSKNTALVLGTRSDINLNVQEHMRITSSGRVGIGTTNPEYKLDVEGTIRSKSVSADTDGTGWKRVAHISGSNGRGQNTVTISTGGGAFSPRSETIRWWHDYGVRAGINVISEYGSGYWNNARVTDDGVDNSYLEVYFTSDVDSLSLSLYFEGGQQRGELYSGILPNGGGNVRATAKLGGFFNSNDKFFIDTSGNVGIGTTNPTAKLDVRQTIAGGDALKLYDDGISKWRFDIAPGEFRYIAGHPSSVAHVFGKANYDDTGYSELMRINPNGDLIVAGKATISGGVDPPYVSFSAESHESIKEYAKNVGEHEKAMLFWNDDAHRMEIYDISNDSFYTITGEHVVYT